MIRPAFVALRLARHMLVPAVLAGVSVTAIGAHVASGARPGDRVSAAVPRSDSIKVVLLGTGVGPVVNLQ